MRTAVFSTKSYDRRFLKEANDHRHDLTFFEWPLNTHTVKLLHDFEAVCVFVNDRADRVILEQLAKNGIRLLALRCAGFNNVDIPAAAELGITVARVPAYSPHGVAEHAVALMLALNRKIYRAHNRIRDGNFSLEGLMGFEMHGKCAGIIGTGKIGELTAGILKGFSMRLFGYDTRPNPACEAMGMTYLSLDELYATCDIISLHVPLLPATHHLIDDEAVGRMKDGVMIINTSRGGLIKTQSVIDGLKSGRIGYLGLDVYEEEADLFFEDLSDSVIQDDVFARLLTFPNVIITGHQAFFTDVALNNIAETTIANLTGFAAGHVDPANLVKPRA
ncbi:MAG: 2-hydroxyacid dehydrogenase [Candidatus Omnitrophica bacterium]|nr:2-hydroxyacid dehydrogenase [Candidatus Omnitrophota bacterium]